MKGEQIFYAVQACRGYAYNIIGDLNDVDDILQETTLKLLKRGSGVPEPPTELSRYVMSSIRNVYYDWCRSKYHRNVVHWEPPDVRIESITEARESLDSVKKIIQNKLTERRRIALTLSVEGYSNPEIEKITGQTKAVVRELLCHSRRIIKKEYKKVL